MIELITSLKQRSPWL